MSAIDTLFRDPEPLSFTPEKDQLFLEGMKEAVAHHRKHSPDFRGICEGEGFTENDLASWEDVKKIPFLFVNVFKEYQLLSVPEEEIVLSLTSSGTTSNKRSQNYWDQTSLDRLNESVLLIGNQLGLLKVAPTNYLLFGYNPHEAKDVGTAWSDENIQRLTGGAKEIYYVLQQGEDGEFSFNLEGTINALRRFAEEGLPVRFIGFPAFMHFLAQAWEEKGLPPLELHPDSLAITGGGWKSHRGEEIPFGQFCTELEKNFGIRRVSDIYGLVEHGIPYFTCEHGRFHVPSCCRIFIRRPGTLECLPEGEAGLMQILSPYMHSVPTISILTSDYAVVERCTCGLSSPTFRILGRGGVVKHKGCAIKAAEILGKA